MNWISKDVKYVNDSRGGEGIPDRENSVSIGGEVRKCWKCTFEVGTVIMKPDGT